MTDIIAHGVLTRVHKDDSDVSVLYLHGWGTSHASLLSLSQKVGTGALLYDFPGFGASQLPSVPWSVSEYAAHLVALLQKLRVTPRVIVAHSFGGRVLLKALCESGLAPERIVFIGSAGLRERGMYDHMRSFFSRLADALSRVPLLSQVVRVARLWVRAQNGSAEYLRAGELTETFKRVVSENLRTYAESVQLPTLLLWGSDDTSTPRSEAEAYHRAIQGSQLVFIEGAGHFVHEEREDEVAKLIRDFIS